MPTTLTGTILSGIGGLYTVELDPNDRLPDRTVTCRARGSFRHEGLTPLPGDRVALDYDESASGEGTLCVAAIGERRNSLIRPPMANLDYLFVSMAAAAPAPLLPTVDKLICIAEHNRIEPVIVVGKSDLDPDRAAEIHALYAAAGFDTFTVSCEQGEGVEAVLDYIKTRPAGKTFAFAGASGVGKSTLMNALFPSLDRTTGAVSRKNTRGRHTTREVSLFALSDLLGQARQGSYVADTPGFSLLDFTRFDFFDKDDLPLTMREFAPYLGQCRYTDCTHTKEQDCAVLAALRASKIAKSRHESYLAIYHDLKDKKPWDK